MSIYGWSVLGYYKEPRALYATWDWTLAQELNDLVWEVCFTGPCTG